MIEAKLKQEKAKIKDDDLMSMGIDPKDLDNMDFDKILGEELGSEFKQAMDGMDESMKDMFSSDKTAKKSSDKKKGKKEKEKEGLPIGTPIQRPAWDTGA